jgi:hypothetical protein
MITDAIEDEDEYLSSLGGEVGKAGVFHINLTDEPDEVVSRWADRIRDEVDKDYFEKRHNPPLIAEAMRLLTLCMMHFKKGDLTAVVAKKVSRLFGALSRRGQRSGSPGMTIARFRKKRHINTEAFFTGPCSAVNREMALRKINERLHQEAPLCER